MIRNRIDRRSLGIERWFSAIYLSSAGCVCLQG